MSSSIPPQHYTAGFDQDIIYRGWVFKKRRKKMQGFARRYFVLHQSGMLSYSVDPKQPIRDQIFLPQAAISTAAGRKDIHIDSNNATFHIKCLSMEDFNAWMTAFRKFINSDARKSSLGRATPRLAQYQGHKSGAIAEEIGLTINELENAIALSESEDGQRKHHSASKSKIDKERNKEHHHHKEGGSVFGLFKKSSSHYYEDSPSHTMHDFSPITPSQRVHLALDSLKQQHAALVRSLHPFHLVDNASSAARGSPLPPTAELNEEPVSFSRLSTPMARLSQRASCATSTSDGTPIEWFDAQDGGEEFFLDDMTPEEDRNGVVLQSDSSLLGSDSSEETHDVATPENSNEVDPSVKAREIVRRTHLPSRPVGDEGSLFAILKKNVGKELSSIAFPVSFNEPLTLLQRSAEEVEYYDLLRQAVDASDPLERMCYVAAFAVSSYAHTRHRTSRKGFNPMLGETFEDVRMKFIAEKVQHNPVVLAYHAEGDGWQLYATTAGKTKFWGKSVEIIPLGTTHLEIQGDRFEWNKPSSFMRNIMMGTKYLEHCGRMEIKNTASGSNCDIDFKQSGYWGTSNQISGTITAVSGEVLAQLEGKWDEQVSQTLDPSHLRVLWRIAPFPKQSQEYYGFTLFGMTLNEITNDLEGRLPPSDSRFRPDVRALEEGDVDRAETEKIRVEELQRDRRRRGADRKPRWFKQVGDEWKYVGGYWEARAKGWKDLHVEPLW